MLLLLASYCYKLAALYIWSCIWYLVVMCYLLNIFLSFVGGIAYFEKEVEPFGNILEAFL